MGQIHRWDPTGRRGMDSASRSRLQPPPPCRLCKQLADFELRNKKQSVMLFETKQVFLFICYNKKCSYTLGHNSWRRQAGLMIPQLLIALFEMIFFVVNCIFSCTCMYLTPRFRFIFAFYFNQSDRVALAMSPQQDEGQITSLLLYISRTMSARWRLSRPWLGSIDWRRANPCLTLSRSPTSTFFASTV